MSWSLCGTEIFPQNLRIVEGDLVLQNNANMQSLAGAAQSLDTVMGQVKQNFLACELTVPELTIPTPVLKRTKRPAGKQPVEVSKVLSP